MPVSVSQLIASADTGGEALRLIRAALTLTQADLVARADGTTGADQISLIERGKRPMTSKQCTAIARALHLTDDDEAQLMLLAQIDRAPERLQPILRQVRLRSTLRIVEAFLMAYPPEKMEAPDDSGCLGGGVASRQSEGVLPSERIARWPTAQRRIPRRDRRWHMIS